MKVDLRDLLKKENRMNELSNNHREIFEHRLDQEFNQKSKKRYVFLKIAASVLVLLSLGFGGYQVFRFDTSQIVQSEDKADKKINSMADISPDFKKVEDYYLTHINYQISKIKISGENKELLEVYLSQLGVLQEEYKQMNANLNAGKVREETLDALIENLQLRLQLMLQLKKKLTRIENLKSQENESI